MGAKPVDWFDAGNFPLLVAYCRAAVDAEVIALQIARMGGFDATDRASLARYAKLLRLQDANAGTLARLATKMRCTQQSKMRPDSAAARAAGAPGPWERGKQ